MNSEIFNIINTLFTIFLGGGWFLHWRASRRKANGEAVQSEADGWLKQQEVYQHTIEDLEKACDFIRNDRNQLREENSSLITENNELRKTVVELQNTVFDLKKEVSRLGRRVDAMSDKKSKKKQKSEG